MAIPIAVQKMIEAVIDAESLGVVVNGNDSTDVVTRLGEKYPTIKKAMRLMFEVGGLPATPFTTYALMTESSLSNGDYAVVTDDIALEKNGYYQKKSGTWFYLKYNPMASITDVKDRSVLTMPSLTTQKLNDVVTTGIYRQVSDANATDANNYPEARGGVLEVLILGGVVVQQYTSRFGSSYKRIKDGNYAWQAWQKSATQAELDTTIQIKSNLNNENLNDIVVTGVYRQAVDAKATSINNYPDTRAGTLEVVDSKGLIRQTYTTWYGLQYWRTKADSYAWQAWQKVATQADIDTTIQIKDNLNNENLDTLIETGIYRQTSDAKATVANKYPDNRAGLLEVVSSDGLIAQTYTTWFGKRFWRTKSGSYNFQNWREQLSFGDITVNTPYTGKKIAWFGDSIVEGNDHPNRVANNLGASVLKFGFASSTMGYYPSELEGLDKMSMYKFAKAINTGDFSDVMAGAVWRRDNKADDNTPQVTLMQNTDWLTVDYLVIAFGTNDWTSPTPLGDSLEPDATGATYLGATAYVVEQIQAAHPHIQIMFVSPVFRTRQFNRDPQLNSDTVTDLQGKSLYDVVLGLQSVCYKYHLPFYDFYQSSGINVQTYGQYLGDGVHPNARGVQLWAKKLTAFMLNY